jgi:hypothetical protein
MGVLRNIVRVLCCCCVAPAFAQIDPDHRELIQVGYNGALEGHQPISAYAFYYRNQPGFLDHTNLTLRIAVAPTYLDSELGFAHALGENTDFGLGLAGGGFADSYAEIRQGTYLPEESFIGHGGEIRASVYHLFNPGAMIPLNGVLRGAARFSVYDYDDNTDPNFQLPHNRGTFSVRTGLRWGGREPMLFPRLAMELSIWYEGQYRTDDDLYGYQDRRVQSWSHIFWGQATLVYTLPESGHSFDISLAAGTSITADRFSAYRLGALLPMISEYPLSIPGYYYQEISADQFALLSANYLLPLESSRRWYLDFNGATAVVDYLPGLEQPGNSHSGVGAGILYSRSSWKVLVGYAYGVDAIRSHGRGANSIGVLLQLDWGRAKHDVFNPTTPNLWRGFQRIFGLFGA